MSDRIDETLSPAQVVAAGEVAIFRVAVDSKSHCPQCGQLTPFWTVAWIDDGEENQLGQSWSSREMAQDVADHMNMAYAFALEKKAKQ